MNPQLQPDEMSTEELINEVDNCQENIETFEEGRMFKEYMGYKIFQDSCAVMLRQRAVEDGNFQSKFFQFQKVDKENTDWKAICRYLVDQKLVTGKAMESAIEAFTEKKPYGKMVKIKQKDISLKIS